MTSAAQCAVFTKRLLGRHFVGYILRDEGWPMVLGELKSAFKQKAAGELDVSRGSQDAHTAIDSDRRLDFEQAGLLDSGVYGKPI